MKKQVPIGALCLGYEGPTAAVQFVQDGEVKIPKLNMIAYSGGIIKNHYWWDNLILDLTGIQFSKKKFPILERHDTALKIGFHDGHLIVDGNLRVDPEKAKFVSTPESEVFQRLSSEGFPYQASIKVNPLVIERIKEGAFSEANGIKLKGPGTIFRKFEFLEASVCVFGYDTNTKSSAFEQQSVEIDCEFTGDRSYHFFTTKEEKKNMDLTAFQKEHPELVQQIQNGAVAAFEKVMDQKISDLTTKFNVQFESMQKTIDAQATQLKAKDDQILKLEKNDTLRQEHDLQLEANRIWDTELSASNVPAHMSDKIRPHVAHSKFVDPATGKCDFAKFTDAVKAEIKDWETRLSAKPSSVLGGGTYGRTPEGGADETALDAEDDKWAENMAKLAQDAPEQK